MYKSTIINFYYQFLLFFIGLSSEFYSASFIHRMIVLTTADLKLSPTLVLNFVKRLCMRDCFSIL